MKTNHNAPVFVPGAGATSVDTLVSFIEAARAASAPAMVIDRPGFLVAGGLAAEGDLVFDGMDCWPWSLFAENLTEQEVKVFAAAMIPSGAGPSRSVHTDAQQLLVDVINALKSQSTASHAELRRLIQDATLDELRQLVAGTASEPALLKANQLTADSVRAAAAAALQFLPHSTAEVQVSLRDLAPGKVLWLRGCGGNTAVAMAALTLSISHRQPKIVFTTRPEHIPACLRVGSKATLFSNSLSRMSTIAEACAALVDNKVRDWLVHEVNATDWTPPRPGWRQFRLGRAELAPHAEAAHMTFIGAPGTGKSVGIFSLLDQVRDYEMPAIVYDCTGDFIRRYYDPDRGDIILSPVDERSPAWNLFDELSLSFDLDKVGASLIEEPKSGDKYWVDNARIVLRDILTALKARGETTNADLFNAVAKMDLVWMPTEGQLEGWRMQGAQMGLKDQDLDAHIAGEKEKARQMDLQTLLQGMQAANLVNPQMGKTAPIIRSQLSASMAAWAFLRDGGERFNISEFVRNPGKRFLFLQSRSDMQSMLRPLITLWIELAANAQLALPTNRPGHRLFFVIDELPGLQRLDSLEKLMAEGRKYGACVVTGIQLVSQLYKRYGREAGEALLGLHSTLVALRTKEPTSAKYMSEAFGNKISRLINTTRTISANDDRDQVSLAETRTKEALLIEGDFIAMRTLHAYIASPDRRTVLVKFTPSSRRPSGTDSWRDEDGLPMPYALREDVTIDAYVEAAKQAAEAETKLEKVSQGADFEELFGVDETWTAANLLPAGKGAVLAIGAAAKERAKGIIDPSMVDPETGEIFEPLDDAGDSDSFEDFDAMTAS